MLEFDLDSTVCTAGCFWRVIQFIEHVTRRLLTSSVPDGARLDSARLEVHEWKENKTDPMSHARSTGGERDCSVLIHTEPNHFAQSLFVKDKPKKSLMCYRNLSDNDH